MKTVVQISTYPHWQWLVLRLTRLKERKKMLILKPPYGGQATVQTELGNITIERHYHPGIRNEYYAQYRNKIGEGNTPLHAVNNLKEKAKKKMRVTVNPNEFQNVIYELQ